MTLDPPKVGNEIKKPKAKIKLHTQIKSDLFDMRKYAARFQRLKRVHKEANKQQIDEIGQGISAGKIPFKQGKVELNNKDILKSLFMKVAKKSVPREAKPNTVDIKHVVVNDFDQLTVTEQKIWEVFFDHKDKNSNKGHRIDPLILDLNKDGKFDITGANQEGNGKIDGPTVNFDIDPSKQSWRLIHQT